MGGDSKKDKDKEKNRKRKQKSESDNKKSSRTREEKNKLTTTQASGEVTPASYNFAAPCSSTSHTPDRPRLSTEKPSLKCKLPITEKLAKYLRSIGAEVPLPQNERASTTVTNQMPQTDKNLSTIAMDVSRPHDELASATVKDQIAETDQNLRSIGMDVSLSQSESASVTVKDQIPDTDKNLVTKSTSHRQRRKTSKSSKKDTASTLPEQNTLPIRVVDLAALLVNPPLPRYRLTTSSTQTEVCRTHYNCPLRHVKTPIHRDPSSTLITSSTQTDVPYRLYNYCPLQHVKTRTRRRRSSTVTSRNVEYSSSSSSSDDDIQNQANVEDMGQSSMIPTAHAAATNLQSQLPQDQYLEQQRSFTIPPSTVCPPAQDSGINALQATVSTPLTPYLNSDANPPGSIRPIVSSETEANQELSSNPQSPSAFSRKQHRSLVQPQQSQFVRPPLADHHSQQYYPVQDPELPQSSANLRPHSVPQQPSPEHRSHIPCAQVPLPPFRLPQRFPFLPYPQSSTILGPSQLDLSTQQQHPVPQHPVTHTTLSHTTQAGVAGSAMQLQPAQMRHVPIPDQRERQTIPAYLRYFTEQQHPVPQRPVADDPATQSGVLDSPPQLQQAQLAQQPKRKQHKRKTVPGALKFRPRTQQQHLIPQQHITQPGVTETSPQLQLAQTRYVPIPEQRERQSVPNPLQLGPFTQQQYPVPQHLVVRDLTQSGVRGSVPRSQLAQTRHVPIPEQREQISVPTRSHIRPFTQQQYPVPRHPVAHPTIQSGIVNSSPELQQALLAQTAQPRIKKQRKRKTVPGPSQVSQITQQQHPVPQHPVAHHGTTQPGGTRTTSQLQMSVPEQSEQKTEDRDPVK